MSLQNGLWDPRAPTIPRSAIGSGGPIGKADRIRPHNVIGRGETELRTNESGTV